MAGVPSIRKAMASDPVSATTVVQPAGASEVEIARLGLTRREVQIIGALVDGQTNKDIATTFGISEYTVKHHLTNIYDKLGVYNRVELVLFAINRGLCGCRLPVSVSTDRRLLSVPNEEGRPWAAFSFVPGRSYLAPPRRRGLPNFCPSLDVCRLEFALCWSTTFSTSTQESPRRMPTRKACQRQTVSSEICSL